MRDPGRLRLVSIVSLAAIMLPCGCTAPPPEPDFHSSSEASRLAAARIALREKDESKLDELVEMLYADAPGLRLVAIEALERLTGETFGYEYYARPMERAAAIERWDEYLRSLDGQR